MGTKNVKQIEILNALKNDNFSLSLNVYTRLNKRILAESKQIKFGYSIKGIAKCTR